MSEGSVAVDAVSDLLFPPVHVYALLAAAFAILTVCMSNKLYASERGWIRMIPLVPLGLVTIHITFIFLYGQWKYHVHVHVGMIWAFALIGIFVYNEYLKTRHSGENAGI